MADTVVYIDGLNFYYGAVAKRPDWKWVDFEALARILVPLDDILLIRYFTAIIRPRFAGDRSPERQNAYIRAVRSNPLTSSVCSRRGIHCTICSCLRCGRAG